MYTCFILIFTYKLIVISTMEHLHVESNITVKVKNGNGVFFSHSQRALTAEARSTNTMSCLKLNTAFLTLKFKTLLQENISHACAGVCKIPVYTPMMWHCTESCQRQLLYYFCFMSTYRWDGKHTHSFTHCLVGCICLVVVSRVWLACFCSFHSG